MNTSEAKRLLDIASYRNKLVTEDIVRVELEIKKLHSFVADHDKEIAKIELELKNDN